MLDERENFKQMIQSAKNETNDRIEATEAEGYSSMEIPEPKVEKEEVPEVEETVDAVEEETAEPKKEE